EALVGMLDQVAAALQVTPRPDRIEALVALLAEPAALPEADFDFDALPEELLELDPLELAFEPLESAPADLPPLVAADPDPAPILAPAPGDPGERPAAGKVGSFLGADRERTRLSS